MTTTHAHEDTADMRHLSEQDWLTHWAGTLADLEQHRTELTAAGLVLAPGPAAHLDGQAEMLRSILVPRAALPGS